MSWEDDVLSAYEHSKAKAEAQDRLKTRRAHMLEEQHEEEWVGLKEAVTNRCFEVNGRSGRLILESADPRPNFLTVKREDGHAMRAEYSPKSRTAMFSSETLSYVEDNYELTVRPVNGVDRIVWLHMEKKSIHHAEDVSKFVIAKFLRAGFI